MKEKNLYYVIEADGYHIYDHNDPMFHIHQHEPYIPDKTKSYEENAKAQIDDLMIETEQQNDLSEKVKALEEQSQMLRDCIMEMSEILYA